MHVDDVEPLPPAEPPGRGGAAHEVADQQQLVAQAPLDSVHRHLVMRQVLPSLEKVPEAIHRYAGDGLVAKPSIRRREDAYVVSHTS